MCTRTNPATAKSAKAIVRSYLALSPLLIGAGETVAAVNHSAAAQDIKTIQITKDQIGSLPTNFALFRTGKGGIGQWAVVHDPTALAGAALEQSSSDEAENRFPIAIYEPISLKNVELRARLKIVSGSMRNAGIIVCFVDPKNYYVVSASALEGRVDPFRVLGGKLARIAGTEADIVRDHWYRLAVLVDGDQFTVSLDNVPLFTAWDRTFLVNGGAGL